MSSTIDMHEREGYPVTDHQDRPRPTKPSRASGDPLTFDSKDRWSLGLLLALVVLATVVVEVVQPIRRWTAGQGIPVDIIVPVTAPDLLLPVGDGGAGSVEVLVPAPDALWRLLDLAPGVLTAAMVVLGCWWLVGVMRTIAAGDPFHPANVRRLRALGGLLVIGAPVVFFVELSVAGAILGRADVGDVDVATHLALPWVPLVAGMVVALLAEAFKAGSALREDVEGLV